MQEPEIQNWNRSVLNDENTPWEFLSFYGMSFASKSRKVKVTKDTDYEGNKKSTTLQSCTVHKAHTKILCPNIQQKCYLTQILAQPLLFLTSCDSSIAGSFKGKLQVGFFTYQCWLPSDTLLKLTDFLPGGKLRLAASRKYLCQRGQCFEIVESQQEDN